MNLFCINIWFFFPSLFIDLSVSRKCSNLHFLKVDFSEEIYIADDFKNISKIELQVNFYFLFHFPGKWESWNNKLSLTSTQFETAHFDWSLSRLISTLLFFEEKIVCTSLFNQPRFVSQSEKYKKKTNILIRLLGMNIWNRSWFETYISVFKCVTNCDFGRNSC